MISHKTRQVKKILKHLTAVYLILFFAYSSVAVFNSAILSMLQTPSLFYFRVTLPTSETASYSTL